MLAKNKLFIYTSLLNVLSITYHLSINVNLSGDLNTTAVSAIGDNETNTFGQLLVFCF